jgi:uncharacterized membrane protein
MEGGSVRIWDWIVGAAGLAIVIGVFMPWYRSNQENWTAWKTLMLIDLLIVLTGLLAMALPIIAGLKATDKQAQKLLLVLVVLAIACVAFTIYRMNTPPEFDTVLEPITLKAGAYLTLVASAVIVLGSALGARARLAHRARA